MAPEHLTSSPNCGGDLTAQNGAQVLRDWLGGNTLLVHWRTTTDSRGSWIAFDDWLPPDIGQVPGYRLKLSTCNDTIWHTVNIKNVTL